MPDISVIIPVFNTEKYLRECAESVLSDNKTDIELILVDDGSTDCSAELCDQIAREDGRVRVIRQKNSGQSAARNRGAAAARSELLMFIDSDDVAAPGLPGLFLKTMNETGAGAVTCERMGGAVPPDGFGSREAPETDVYTADEDTLLSMFKNNDTVYWTLFPSLIKKSVYERCPLPEGRVMEDNATACKWLVASGTVAVIKAPLYFYRENPNGTMNSAFSAKKLDFLKALEDQIGFFDEIGYERLSAAVAGEYVRAALWLAGRVKKELKDDRLAGRVISDAARMRKLRRGRIELTEKEESDLFRAAHPLLHRIKKKIG